MRREQDTESAGAKEARETQEKEAAAERASATNEGAIARWITDYQDAARHGEDVPLPPAGGWPNKKIEVQAKAIAEFGTTEDVRNAGWMMEGGELIDFHSRVPGGKFMLHGTITKLIDGSAFKPGVLRSGEIVEGVTADSSGQMQFMREGNAMRLQYFGSERTGDPSRLSITLVETVKPNQKQKRVLVREIRKRKVDLVDIGWFDGARTQEKFDTSTPVGIKIFQQYLNRIGK